MIGLYKYILLFSSNTTFIELLLSNINSLIDNIILMITKYKYNILGHIREHSLYII